MLSLGLAGVFSLCSGVSLTSESGSGSRTGLRFLPSASYLEKKRALFSRALHNTMCALTIVSASFPFHHWNFDPCAQGLLINLIIKSLLKLYPHEAQFWPPQGCRGRKPFEETPTHRKAEPVTKSSLLVVPLGWAPVGSVGELTLPWIGA